MLHADHDDTTASDSSPAAIALRGHSFPKLISSVCHLALSVKPRVRPRFRISLAAGYNLVGVPAAMEPRLLC